MRLNETREWPQELSVNGADFKVSLMKAAKQVEASKQTHALQTSKAPKPPAKTKKVK